MNDPRGSVWRKWDLHVHTPDSLLHQYGGADPWARFLDEIEALPAEFKVIGINDYIFLDGYRRILAEQEKGRLKNIDLFLPVIELRLDKFGGSASHLSRVNYHVIFSNGLTPDTIEQQFLNALSSKYVLSPEYNHLRGKWAAIATKQSLFDLGTEIINSVPPEERGKFHAPLIEGFNNLCVSLDALKEALGSHYFDGKFATAVGKTEWADIKWNDQSIAEKKTIINDADLVFISSETIEDWQKARDSLTSARVNNRLLDCSDAHAYSDAAHKNKLGKCWTWIKADPTFEGLLQVLNEPESRVFVGEEPPKLVQVRSNKTKFINSISIERKTSATLPEIWFNNIIPLNCDLIAIIGNKGKGKSALTDTIGLLCNTKQHADFTFLSQQSFRQPRDNKAKYFTAKLTWESGSTITKGLDETVDEEQPELVKYIPQNFLEKICTQLGRIEESAFDRELKKVIFSHVEPADRLGKASLDELISYKTSEADAKLRILKRELHRLNEQIISVEDRSQPAYRTKLQNLLALKRTELEAHHKTKPAAVVKPETDPVKQREISKVTLALDAAKKELAEFDNQIQQLTTERGRVAQFIATCERLIGRVENLEREIQAFVSDSKSDLANIGLTTESIIQVKVDKQPLFDKRKTFFEREGVIAAQLDPTKSGTVAQKKTQTEAKIKQLQSQLDEPNKNYQRYEGALKMWELRQRAITGAADKLDTIKYFESELSALDNIPNELTALRRNRLAKSKEIHAVVRQLTDAYRELYGPVHDFIESRSLAKEKFHLNFDVSIVDAGFLDRFFSIVSHGLSGSFCGIEEGRKVLGTILARHDFNTEGGIESFITEIMDALEHDRRPGGNATRPVDQIRKGKDVCELYDLIFSLDYLKPRYALKMADKELQQLSPGERGTLLLVFYLLVDRDDIPLVIDQPEENLDNQTVYELLVPCMKEAKMRRQIFIVTHNPNLAVVCDAEQVICAELNKKANYRMDYLSGAIENPAINRAIVDVLEGTMPAFKNRDSKYYGPDDVG